MTTKELNKLNVGDTVYHKRYGKCTVKSKIPDFGPVIEPSTEDGKKLLMIDSRTDISDYLCSDYKQNLKIQKK